MPRVTLAHTMNDVPLTVAAAAQKVGVSPSTLRTWDRRYKLSPSARTVGAHRRYTALDIARLERMCSLIARGVSASDAAHLVTSEPIDSLGVDYEISVIYPEDIETAAKTKDELTIRSILDKAIADEGLVRTWMDYIKPALTHIRNNREPRRPGFCPVLFLQYVVLETIGRVMKEAEAHFAEKRKESPQERIPQVFIASNYRHIIEVNILGTALTWEGFDIHSLCTNTSTIDEASCAYVHSTKPDAVIFVEDVCSLDTITQIQSEGATVVLAGDEAPKTLNPQVVRLRTMTATVDELVQLLCTR